MSRRCMLTGKSVMSGNNVSHAVNKTRRKFLPNLQRTDLHSEALGRSFRLRVCTRALKTVDRKGGLDGYLLSVSDVRLPLQARALKRRIRARLGHSA